MNSLQKQFAGLYILTIIGLVFPIFVWPKYSTVIGTIACMVIFIGIETCIFGFAFNFGRDDIK